MPCDQELFDLVGGEEGMSKIVNLFYDIVLQDEVLKPFFEHTDMNKQKERQKQFICHLIADTPYHGRTMKELHKNMGLEDIHFDHFMLNLKFAMRMLDVDTAAAEKIQSLVDQWKPDIVQGQESIEYHYHELFEKIGKEEGVNQLVYIFYDFMWKDEVTQKYLERGDMLSQIKLQKEFICHVIGGQPFSNQDMNEMYKIMGRTDTEFDHALKNLESAMKENKIPDDVVADVIKLVDYQRKNIVKDNVVPRLKVCPM